MEARIDFEADRRLTPLVAKRHLRLNSLFSRAFLDLTHAFHWRNTFCDSESTLENMDEFDKEGME